MTNRVWTEIRHLVSHRWAVRTLLLACVCVGVWGACGADALPYHISVPTLADASVPRRAMIEYDSTGQAFRWLGDRYPVTLPLRGRSSIVSIRFWVPAGRQQVSVSTPHGSVNLDPASVTQPRVVSLLATRPSWWQDTVLTVSVTPPRAADTAWAFAGARWRTTANVSLLMPGLLGAAWVLAWALLWRTPGGALISAMGAAILLVVCPPTLQVSAGGITICAAYILGRSSGRFPWYIWGSSLALTAGLGIARMYRPPSDFAELHWLLSYDAGFIKRGLIGTLMPHSWQTEAGIWIIAVVVLFLGVLMNAVLTARAIHTSTDPLLTWAVALVVASSPATLMQGFLVGYFDEIVLLGVVAGYTALCVGQRSPAWIGVLWGVLVLVHETTLLFVIAWALVYALLTISTTPDPSWQSRTRALLRTLWVVGIPVVTFILVAVGQRLQSTTTLHTAILAQAAATPFATHDSSYDVARQFADWTVMSFADHAAKYSADWYARLTSRESWIVFPTLCVLWIASAARWWPQRGRWWITVLVPVVTVLPITLSVIAVDTGRIATYGIAIGWYAWIWLERWAPAAPGPRWVRWTALGAVGIVGIANGLVQPTWLVPYDRGAVLPVGLGILALPGIIAAAWYCGQAIRRRS